MRLSPALLFLCSLEKEAGAKMQTFAFIDKVDNSFIYTMLSPLEQRQAIKKLLKQKVLINENLKKKYNFKQSTGRVILAIDELEAPRLLLNCAFFLNLNILSFIKALQHNRAECLEVLKEQQDRHEASQAIDALLNQLKDITMYNFQKLVICKNKAKIEEKTQVSGKIDQLIKSGSDCPECEKKKRELEEYRKSIKKTTNAPLPRKPAKSGKTIKRGK